MPLKYIYPYPYFLVLDRDIPLYKNKKNAAISVLIYNLAASKEDTIGLLVGTSSIELVGTRLF